MAVLHNIVYNIVIVVARVYKGKDYRTPNFIIIYSPQDSNAGDISAHQTPK